METPKKFKVGDFVRPLRANRFDSNGMIDNHVVLVTGLHEYTFTGLLLIQTDYSEPHMHVCKCDSFPYTEYQLVREKITLKSSVEEADYTSLVEYIENLSERIAKLEKRNDHIVNEINAFLNKFEDKDSEDEDEETEVFKNAKEIDRSFPVISEDEDIVIIGLANENDEKYLLDNNLLFEYLDTTLFSYESTTDSVSVLLRNPGHQNVKSVSFSINPREQSFVYAFGFDLLDLLENSTHICIGNVIYKILLNDKRVSYHSRKFFVNYRIEEYHLND